jgi:glycosyltransferase involved in cell wall biosynthesis
LEAAAVVAVVQVVVVVTESRNRILFVGAFPPLGGAILGGHVTSCRILLSSSFPERLDLDLLDSTQISNPPPGIAVRLVRAAGRFSEFIGRFERRRPDAVLLFVAVGGSIVAKGIMAWYARLRGVPVIMFPRGGSVVNDCHASAFTRAWVGWSFRAARKIICQSESWRQFAVDMLGFDRANVAVIRNWTATREMLDVGARRIIRREPTVHLLFLGWLERDKGVLDLLEACGKLTGTCRFTLEIAGEGNASVDARALVTQCGLSELVHFRGWLRGDALLQALSKADVLVLPSWAEGLPNAMIEAMAARLAVVVTRVGAIPELIQDRRNGLLVEPRSADALARALREIIADSELRENLAREAYFTAMREFEVEGAVNRLVAEIENTIAAGREHRLSGRVQ